MPKNWAFANAVCHQDLPDLRQSQIGARVWPRWKQLADLVAPYCRSKGALEPGVTEGTKTEFQPTPAAFASMGQEPERNAISCLLPLLDGILLGTTLFLRCLPNGSWFSREVAWARRSWMRQPAAAYFLYPLLTPLALENTPPHTRSHDRMRLPWSF